MTRKSDNVCPQSCPDRHTGCHAECEIYLDFFRENAKTIEARQNQVPINNYTVEAIQRMKSGRGCTTNRYRPKGRW